jgi:hypothetical protein
VDDSHLQRLLQSQQQTISLLVSEKASLTAALERLEGLDESTQCPIFALNDVDDVQSMGLCLDNWKQVSEQHKHSKVEVGI